MSNSFKFTRTVTSVVTTVGLVASAMTGLLYSTPVSAASATLATSPSTSSPVTAGRPFIFKFTVSNSNSGSGSDSIRVALSGSNGTFTTPALLADTGCKVAIDGAGTLNTDNCTTLLSATGVLISSLPKGASTTVTVNSLISTTTPTTSTNDLTFNLLSSSTVNNFATIGDIQTTNVTYDAVFGNSLTISKDKVAVAPAAAGTVTGSADAIFKLTLENSSTVAYNNVKIKDRIDSNVSSYFSACTFYPNVIANSASTLSASTGDAVNSDLVSTISTIPAATDTSSTSKVTVYVACTKKTGDSGTIPSGSIGYNRFNVTDYDGKGNESLPSEASVSISGSGNLEVKKSLTSGSVSTSGATYTIRITNTSNRAADAGQLVDIIQVPYGVTVSTLNGVGNVKNELKDDASNNIDYVLDTGANGLSKTYPANSIIAKGLQAGGITGYARELNFGKIPAGKYVEYSYSLKYDGSFATTCTVNQAAPITRNSAVLAKTNAITSPTAVDVNNVNGGWLVTGSNDISVSGIAGSFLKFDGTKATILSNIIYSDTNSDDNLAFVDKTNDVCEPDMQILDVKKSEPSDSTTVALIGENTEYTVRYRNYAAKVNGTNDARSSAKGINFTITLPNNASFVGVTAPGTGTTNTVTNPTVNIAGLPDIALGDDTIKELKFKIKQADGVASAATESLLIAKVNANKEISGFNIDCREQGNTRSSDSSCDASLDATPTAQATSVTRGNNAAQRKLTLKGGPDVQVMKSVDLGEGQLKMDSSMLTYTVKVKNIGTETANSVMVRDTLPTCTTFDSKVSGPDGTLTADGRNIDYNAGNLNVGQELVMVFKAKINQNDACKINNSTVIQNSATATISGSQKDLNVTNNTGIANSSVVALNQNAALTKTVDQLVAQPGATLNYTITLKGQGSTFKGTLMDELPAGVTFVSAEPAAVRDGNKLTWSNLSVEAAKPLTATVKVTVNGDTTGTVVNKVTATTTDGKLNFAQAVTSIEVAGNAKVTGYIFFDANNNKKEDKLERSATYADYLGNIRVVAMSSNGKEYSAITNKDGSFTIDKLPAGKYSVKVDINTVKGSYKNIALNAVATDPSADKITKVADVRSNESLDLAAGFRLFTNQTVSGATSANGFASVTAMVAMLSFSFLATFAYAQARKRALSL